MKSARTPSAVWNHGVHEAAGRGNCRHAARRAGPLVARLTPPQRAGSACGPAESIFEPAPLARSALMLHTLGGFKRWRRSTLRFQEENARIEEWLGRIEELAVDHLLIGGGVGARPEASQGLR